MIAGFCAILLGVPFLLVHPAPAHLGPQGLKWRGREVTEAEDLYPDELIKKKLNAPGIR